MFNGQYVQYVQNSIFYHITIYCFAIQFSWSFKNLCLTLSTYYITKQYILSYNNILFGDAI